MIELVLGLIILFATLGVIIKVTTPARHEEHPSVVPSKELEALEKQVHDKVEKTIGMAQLMNELEQDEIHHRSHPVSESDTMRSIRHKVEKLDKEV